MKGRNHQKNLEDLPVESEEELQEKQLRMESEESVWNMQLERRGEHEVETEEAEAGTRFVFFAMARSLKGLRTIFWITIIELESSFVIELQSSLVDYNHLLGLNWNLLDENFRDCNQLEGIRLD